MALSFFAAIFLKEANFFVYVIFALIGIGWAAINVNSFPMVIEMCKGADIGKYTGYYYTFSMAAQIFTPIFSGLFIANENIGYASLFPYAAICSALAFVCMLFVKHGEPEKVENGDKKSLLEHLDIDD
jgi:MFS family permease